MGTGLVIFYAMNLEDASAGSDGGCWLDLTGVEAGWQLVMNGENTGELQVVVLLYFRCCVSVSR